MRLTCALLALFMFNGCMSTKLQLSPGWNRRAPPAYVDYMDYYLLGLVGDPYLSIPKICMDQQPHGVQKIKTVEDSLITLFTLGIYSPITVKVWCGE